MENTDGNKLLSDELYDSKISATVAPNTHTQEVHNVFFSHK